MLRATGRSERLYSNLRVTLVRCRRVVHILNFFQTLQILCTAQRGCCCCSRVKCTLLTCRLTGKMRKLDNRGVVYVDILQELMYLTQFFRAASNEPEVHLAVD